MAARFLTLLVFCGLSLAAGALGSVWTSSSIPTWYAGLVKPAWNPPNWVFAPVWTALYLLMGVAASLVWFRSSTAAGPALALFVGQLMLNAAWSWLFFGLRRPDWAFAELAVLWIAIAATALAFHRHSPVAAWLLAPYLAWVSYAGTLNYAIWRLNPSAGP